MKKNKTYALKWALVFLLTSILILVLESCTKENNNQTESGLKKIENFNINLSVPVQSELWTNTFNASSEQGYYTIERISPEFYNIFYMDYETNEYNYLCKNPHCSHDNESCTSYIKENTLAQPQPFYIGDKILILFYSGDGTYSAGGCTMDLDGSNKQTLFELSANQSIQLFPYKNGDYLFFLLQTNMTNGKTVSSIVQCNLKTGELEQGLTLGNEYWDIMNIYENKLFLCRIKSVNYDGDTPIIPRGVQEPYINDIYMVDMENPSLDNEIFSYISSEANAIVSDGVLYTCDYAKNMLIKHDYINDTEELMNIDLPHADNEQIEISFDQYLDDKLTITTFLFNPSSGERLNGNGERCIVDFENKTFIPASTLKMENNAQNLISIVAEHDDYFYVITDYKDITRSFTMENGETQEEIQQVPVYAFISKEDYYQSIPNYTYVTNKVL